MKKTNWKKYLIMAVAAIAIAWDLSTAKIEVEEGTFRYESEFDAVSGATTTVSIVTSDFSKLSNPINRTEKPSYQQIEEMVGKAIELQGGFEDVISKGNTVLLKVNLVGGNSPSGQGENTDVNVVKALVKHIGDFTENDVKIQIAEGTARTNDDPESRSSVWANSGYRSLLTDKNLEGINLSLLNLNQSVEDLIEIDLGHEGTSAPQGTKYHVHRAELEADVYIAVPVLKIHDTGITNALKLQIGSAPGCYYGYNKTSGTALCPEGIYHDVNQRRWTTEAIVDLCNIADIDFVVVDAIMTLESQKTNKGYNQVRMNTVLAGKDPVAIDHVSAKLMGLNPDDVAHITLAEKIGLGTNNWDKIYVEGVSVEKARMIVKKSQAADGKFGQSNRTWILSPAFEGSDITQQYIPNEASYQPVEGNDGWSEPVYFFDDRIDLYSYYGGKTNITSYAYTDFNAPESMQAELWLGTHEAMYIYINGVLEYEFTSTASYGNSDRGTRKKYIDIKEGRNTLLVKTINKFGDYSFALNICEVESNTNYAGNRVEGLTFYLDKATSVNSPSKLNEDIKLTCYPNPVADVAHLQFELSEPANATLKMYDITGKLVLKNSLGTYPIGKHKLNWELKNKNINNGTYFISIETDTQSENVKIIVNR